MRVYKIVPSDVWDQAVASGEFRGSGIDLDDGFIHLSSAEQVRETAALHFAGQEGLLLIEFDTDDLGDALRWEASRGGAMFPHVYGSIGVGLAKWACPMPWKNGTFVFPQDLAE
ncbi:MAG: DUF952 domain-containing protein [Planctomycetota bacterium]